MDKRVRGWWLAGTAALIVASFFGVRAVMAQETTTPEATATLTASQDAPEAEETPGANETPDTDDESEQDETEGDHASGCGGKFVDRQALATFLGITTDELQTQLAADGATLATVAQANGQSREALITFLTDQTRAALDEKVASGDLTQAEADARLTEFTDRVNALVDAPAGAGRMMGGRHGSMPMDESMS